MTEQQPKQWRLPQLRLYSVEEIDRLYAVNAELLAALKALVDYEDEPAPFGTYGREIMDNAVAAIAKATGVWP
jgi:hypothetical protein